MKAYYADICSVVDISYQNVPYSMLQDYLGDLDKESIATLIAKNGWIIQEEEGMSIVVIRNEEATIRPKKMLARWNLIECCIGKGEGQKQRTVTVPIKERTNSQRTSKSIDTIQIISERGQPFYKGQKAGSQVCPLLLYCEKDTYICILKGGVTFSLFRCGWDSRSI